MLLWMLLTAVLVVVGLMIMVSVVHGGMWRFFCGRIEVAVVVVDGSAAGAAGA